MVGDHGDEVYSVFGAPLFAACEFTVRKSGFQSCSCSLEHISPPLLMFLSQLRVTGLNSLSSVKSFSHSSIYEKGTHSWEASNTLYGDLDQ